MDTDELKWLGEAPLMAAYRVGHNGKSAAQIGLAAALARGAGKPASSAVRATATLDNDRDRKAQSLDQQAARPR